MPYDPSLYGILLGSYSLELSGGGSDCHSFHFQVGRKMGMGSKSSSPHQGRENLKQSLSVVRFNAVL